jgi:hypothetical protein
MSAEFLDEQAMSFDRFSYGRVNPWRHLLSQKLKQLSVFIHGPTHVGHDFGTHHVLCWSNKPNVVFCLLLQDIGRSLAVVLCQFGEIPGWLLFLTSGASLCLQLRRRGGEVDLVARRLIEQDEAFQARHFVGDELADLALGGGVLL